MILKSEDLSRVKTYEDLRLVISAKKKLCQVISY